MIIDITCPNCNFSKRVPREKIPEGIKFARCPRCNKTFELPTVNNQDTAPQEIDNIDVHPDPVPAADPVNMDEPEYFTGLWRTFKGVLFSPADFFSGLGDDVLRDSFLFGMLLGSVGAMFGLFWQFLSASGDVSYITRIFPESVSTNSIFLGLIIVAPILVFINVIIVTCVLHASLFILQGTSKGFEGTLKVMLYSNATSIFSLIPVLGGLIGFIWSAVVIVIGLREVHHTSTLKAFLALLLPVLLLIIFFVFVIIYFASLMI